MPVLGDTTYLQVPSFPSTPPVISMKVQNWLPLDHVLPPSKVRYDMSFLADLGDGRCDLPRTQWAHTPDDISARVHEPEPQNDPDLSTLSCRADWPRQGYPSHFGSMCSPQNCRLPTQPPGTQFSEFSDLKPLTNPCYLLLGGPGYLLTSDLLPTLLRTQICHEDNSTLDFVGFVTQLRHPNLQTSLQTAGREGSALSMRRPTSWLSNFSESGHLAARPLQWRAFGTWIKP